jgi:hypothetical protein
VRSVLVGDFFDLSQSIVSTRGLPCSYKSK